MRFLAKVGGDHHIDHLFDAAALAIIRTTSRMWTAFKAILLVLGWVLGGMLGVALGVTEWVTLVMVQLAGCV